jgi:hypothetical protein
VQVMIGKFDDASPFFSQFEPSSRRHLRVGGFLENRRTILIGYRIISDCRLTYDTVCECVWGAVGCGGSSGHFRHFGANWHKCHHVFRDFCCPRHLPRDTVCFHKGSLGPYWISGEDQVNTRILINDSERLGWTCYSKPTSLLWSTSESQFLNY